MRTGPGATQRDYRTVRLLLACLIWLTAMPARAEIYRWTDDAGKIHYTDNPGTIPPPRRASSRKLSPAPPSYTTSPPGSTTPRPPSPATPSGTSTGRPSSAEMAGLRQREQALEQQIDTARQQRQHYLEQIRKVREVRTNPAFGRGRRQVDEWGRSLGAVTRKLDALQAELRQVQARLRSLQRNARPTTSRPASQVGFDQQGHDRLYWQRRLAPLRQRLNRARAQRRTVLEQLSPETQGKTGTFGRRGREVVRLTRVLEQVEREIRDTQAALRELRQRARQAGAPATWIQ